nr:BA14K family protein [Mesorhizobium neociceri]
MAKGAIDPITTSAVQPSTGDSQPSTGDSTTELPAAHVGWCASRYRSYNPEDNSYRSYAGRQRQCRSPYLDVASEQLTNADFVDTSYSSMDGNASTDDVRPQLSVDHVDYCFSRYRSYRPEDNTYQPYSGGPRRQCQ